MDLSQLGKWLVYAGLGLAGIGILVWVAGKSGLPFGSLPGDIRVERPGFSFDFLVVTCIAVSVILTVLANLVLWFLRK
jgi:hypothetical protein